MDSFMFSSPTLRSGTCKEQVFISMYFFRNLGVFGNECRDPVYDYIFAYNSNNTLIGTKPREKLSSQVSCYFCQCPGNLRDPASVFLYGSLLTEFQRPRLYSSK
jgi:hypothetical protein